MKESVEMLMVRDVYSVVANTARTISLSFAQDPLIKWLRPNAALWNALTPETCKWQRRRVRHAILDGYVFCTGPVGQYAHRTPPQTDLLKQDSCVTETEKLPALVDDVEEDVGATIMLFPPKGHLRWTIQRLLLACKLWLADRVDAAPDNGTCMQRLDRLLTAHDASLDKIRTRYKANDLWYLEVLAVHPLLQGRGLGRRAMLWVLEYLQGAPIMLECTASSNVTFYERFGFEVVEVVELGDDSSLEDDAKTKYWVMFRDRQ